MTESEILEAFAKGGWEREKAFNELVSQYRERLYHVIRGMVSSHEDTDDILQETFIKVYNSLSRFRSDSSLFTWMYRVGINTAISHRRKSALRRFFRLEDTPDEPSSDPLPDEVAATHELRGWIDEAVQGLPEKQRVVFGLRFYDELSHDEISKITGNSVGTIKANFFHALNKVKAHVEKRRK